MVRNNLISNYYFQQAAVLKLTMVSGPMTSRGGSLIWSTETAHASGTEAKEATGTGSKHRKNAKMFACDRRPRVSSVHSGIGLDSFLSFDHTIGIA